MTNVARAQTIAEVKEKVAAQTEVPAGLQRLIFRGKVLKDSLALGVYPGEICHSLPHQPSPLIPSLVTAEPSSEDGTCQIALTPALVMCPPIKSAPVTSLYGHVSRHL